MTDSYEIVFQQVEVGGLYESLVFIKAGAKALSELSISEDIEQVEPLEVTEGLIDSIISHDADICLAGKLHEFRPSEEICLSMVFLRVIKYKDGVDVELSFNCVPMPRVGTVMLAMQGYADTLSKKFHAKEFYGGLEPAIDRDTRYFTGNLRGPLG